MRTIEVKVFKFSELSDKAKDTARNWWREGALDYDWFDSIYEDAETAGLKITGFGLDRDRHAEGSFLSSPAECAESIVKDHGDTCETRKTAEEFLRVRDELVETWPKDENGDFENEYEMDNKLDELEDEFLKSILEDYSILLQKEYEYQLSDECADEAIEANEYEFDEDGNRI